MLYLPAVGHAYSAAGWIKALACPAAAAPAAASWMAALTLLAAHKQRDHCSTWNKGARML